MSALSKMVSLISLILLMVVQLLPPLALLPYILLTTTWRKVTTAAQKMTWRKMNKRTLAAELLLYRVFGQGNQKKHVLLGRVLQSSIVHSL